MKAVSRFLAGAVEASAAEGADPVGDPTFHKVLDAVLEEAATRGVDVLPMETIARRAGVNRTTLYRRFGDLDGILAALAAREGVRMRAAFWAATASIEDPGERLVEGFLVAVRYAREHPLIARAARYEPEGLIAAGLADDARLLAIGAQTLAAEVRRAQGLGLALHLSDPDSAGETLARILASVILLPGGRIDLNDEAALREYAVSTLVPMVLGRLV